MRVGDRGAPQRHAAVRSAGFADALRRERDEVDASRRRDRILPPRMNACGRPPAARREPEALELPGAGDGRAAVRAAGARAPVEAGPVPELAALVRVLPVAVAAATARDGPLALSFGCSLAVELRSTAGGVELLLAPEPRLRRAAEAELPRILSALRLRGIAVARGEVRPRRGGGGQAR